MPAVRDFVLPEHRTAFRALLFEVVQCHPEATVIMTTIADRCAAHPERWARDLQRSARFKDIVRHTLSSLREAGKIRCLNRGLRAHWKVIDGDTSP